MCSQHTLEVYTTHARSVKMTLEVYTPHLMGVVLHDPVIVEDAREYTPHTHPKCTQYTRSVHITT